jgi:hypothetical protein
MFKSCCEPERLLALCPVQGSAIDSITFLVLAGATRILFLDCIQSLVLWTWFATIVEKEMNGSSNDNGSGLAAWREDVGEKILNSPKNIG